MKYLHLIGFVLAAFTATAQNIDALHERDSYSWGAGKEGVRIGVKCNKLNLMTVVIGLADTNIQTAFATKLYLYRSSFSIILKDMAGKEIPKTAEGKKKQKQLKPISPGYWNHRDVQQLEMWGQIPQQVGSFDVDKCFDRKKSGRYTLEVQISVQKYTDDGKNLELIELPSMKLMLDLPDKQD